MTAAEGFILCVGAKIFTIAGPVIVYGTVASVIYRGIYWIMRMIKNDADLRDTPLRVLYQSASLFIVYLTSERYSRGVLPVNCLKTDMKCEQEEKPHS